MPMLRAVVAFLIAAFALLAVPPARSAAPSPRGAVPRSDAPPGAQGGAKTPAEGAGAPVAQTPRRPASGGPIFTEESASTGLDFVHFNGLAGDYFFWEIMGSGGAVLDYDGDGDLDVYLCQGRLLRPGQKVEEALFPPRYPLPLVDRLYRNDLSVGADGKPVLHFTDVTEASRIRAEGYGMGAATGDFDNDGWVDLYVTNHGPNQLWRNNGDGTFTDVTASAATGDPRYSNSAVFLDYDRDGWLDLFVGNNVDSTVANHKICHTRSTIRTYCSPSLFPPLPDRLYHNQRDGTFRDVSAETGIDAEFGPALGVVAADFNSDGWPDIYVANDGKPNLLWINEKGERFHNDALLAGCSVDREGKPQASMGVDAQDFDGDGDLDLFMTHLDRETNTLYVNDGSGMFSDRSVEMGLARPSERFTGFGTSWIDYDNDGDLDILVVNGEVDAIEELHRAGNPFPFGQTNQLFENVGEGRYREVTAEAGEAFQEVEASRGALFADLDNDGDLDVVINNNSGPARVLINQVGNARPWLGLRLLTGSPGRDALGAQVELLRKGAPPLWRRVRTDGSYASANDPRILFGLGGGDQVERLRVLWPSGRVEEFSDVTVGRYTTLREGTGREVE